VALTRTSTVADEQAVTIEARATASSGLRPPVRTSVA